MIRVFGQELDQNKIVEFALLRVYGIGRTRAQKICRALEIGSNVRVRDLTPDYQNKIQGVTNSFGWVVDEDLRRQLILEQKVRDSVNCWTAVRRRKGLPRRGQRTRSNARTARRVK